MGSNIDLFNGNKGKLMEENWELQSKINKLEFENEELQNKSHRFLLQYLLLEGIFIDRFSEKEMMDILDIELDSSENPLTVVETRKCLKETYDLIK